MSKNPSIFNELEKFLASGLPARNSAGAASVLLRFAALSRADRFNVLKGLWITFEGLVAPEQAEHLSAVSLESVPTGRIYMLLSNILESWAWRLAKHGVPDTDMPVLEDITHNSGESDTLQNMS